MKALDLGAEKIVLIMPKYPEPEPEGKDLSQKMTSMMKYYRSFPAVCKALDVRSEIHNASLKKAKELEAQGKLMIVSPKELYGVKSLSKNRQSMQKLYEEGLHDGKAVKEFLEA